MQDGRTAGEKSSIGQAAARDAVIAAKRECGFERISRRNAEAELQDAQRNLCQQQRLAQQLRSQLKQAQSRAQLVSKLEEQLKQRAEQVSVLQTSVYQLQTTLKDCKVELSRKVSRLHAVQVSSHNGLVESILVTTTVDSRAGLIM